MNVLVGSIFWIVVFGVSCAIWGPGAGVAVVVCGALFCQPKSHK